MFRVKAVDGKERCGVKFDRVVKTKEKAQKLAAIWCNAGIQSTATDIKTGERVW